jgi:hypothetical protein
VNGTEIQRINRFAGQHGGAANVLGATRSNSASASCQLVLNSTSLGTWHQHHPIVDSGARYDSTQP